MKSLNYRLPHSRQDSGQFSKQQDNSRPPTFNKPQDNSIITLWNHPDKSTTPMSQAVFKLSSTQSGATSTNHSKKSSISSNSNSISNQTPTNGSLKTKRPEYQQNYYNKPQSNDQPVLQVNNFLKDNNQNMNQQAPIKQDSKPLNNQTQEQIQMSFLNYLMLKEVQQQNDPQQYQRNIELTQKDQNKEKQDEGKKLINMWNQLDTKQESIQKAMFHFKFVIGIGGFGKVWKVDHKKSNQIYAMKEMSKALIITKKSVNSVINERTILSSMKHPFLVNIYYAFQDRENLYLVLDYMQGGDLRFHVGRMRRFSEDQTRFFMACIFLGLELMHNNNIIHRDIKPENLVLDKYGYVRITDMGIARILRPENSQDTSGTPGYMAPEVMCRQNHSFAVDYFALGVMGYEFMLGRRPYVGKTRKDIRDQILSKQVQIKRSDIPDGWSLEAADFINRLIQRKPANRLGFSGPAELRQHSWFKNFPWAKLQNKEIKAPFIPNQKDDNFDAKQISMEDEENNELIQQNALLLRRNSIQSLNSFIQLDLFNEYDYDNFPINTENNHVKQEVNNNKKSHTLQSQLPSKPRTHSMAFN